MFEPKWIKVCLFLGLQVSALTGQYSPVFVVRDGDDVTLPCEDRIENEDRCDGTNWLFSNGGNSPVVELVKRGQTKSDRLSVTEKCSLLIKTVTAEDVGYYTCRQFDTSGRQQDANVHLFLITMSEHDDGDMLMFFCSVLKHGWCRVTVKWLYEDTYMDEFNKDVDTSSSDCSATVTFHSSPNYEALKCKVTDAHTRKELLFNFIHQSQAEKPGEKQDEDTTTTTKMMTTGNNEKSSTDRTKPTGGRLNITVAVVALAAFIIGLSVVKVVRWKRRKGRKTDVDEDDVDPEDVSYASISFTKKNSSKSQTQPEGGDEGDAVTYSAVKTSYSPVGVSTDPSSLYASIN